MTKRVSMPKKLLQRLHLQVPLLPRRQGTPRIRLGKKRRHVKSSSPESLNTPVPPRPRRRSSRGRWLLLWLSIVSIVGVFLITGALLLMKLPPPVDCKNISALASDGDRLDCAQRAADSGKLEPLVAAINLVQLWLPEHPLYTEAQRRTKLWSEAILRLAQQQIRQGNYQEAIKIARSIPVSSPLYPEAQATSATWQEELQKSQNLNNEFQKALKEQKWQLAGALVGNLSAYEQSYWTNDRIQALIQQMSTEKQSWQQLQEARDLVKTNQIAQLEQAIAKVAQINPKSYTHAIAYKEQTRWSRTLIKVASDNYKNQNFLTVVKVLQQIPESASLYQEAQDWTLLARASQTMTKPNILSLLDAIAAVRQIQPDSPLNGLAVKQAKLWESQLQGATKLQIAQLTASLGQRLTFVSAIDYAQAVPLKHPQRLLAQTLIAQWRKEIQQIDNRKLLVEAQKLAEPGTVEQLKKAVEVASGIKLGQPLRQDAQSAIAKWNITIQTIEDQPILDMARTYAQQENLTAAIATASTIRPNRALSAVAQKEITAWVVQVQTAQDRPILEAATALADQGRYEAAIATAEQIPSDRALYPQAQAAIAEWNLLKAPPPSIFEPPLPVTPLPEYLPDPPGPQYYP
ncbi:MAG: hypothetical protein WBG73_23105 [Coleofasciculaceae cyanobacterium]